MDMDSNEPQNDRPVGTLPQLGPVFITGNDAAFWAHQQIGKRRERVYGGLILKRADGRYRATAPLPGNLEGFDFGMLLKTDAQDDFLQPEGYSVYAFYSSRSDQSEALMKELPHWSAPQLRLGNSFFSFNGLRFIIEKRGFCPIYYLSGLWDSLLKYESSGSEGEARFLRVLKTTRLPSDFDAFIDLINLTARVGVLRVVVANAEWGAKAGQVVEPWSLNQAVLDTAQSRQATPYTEVFRRRQDAIRSALPPLEMSTGDSYFGYLLTDDGNEFVAMLPTDDLKHALTSTQGKLSLPAGRPRLPSGFYLHGIYCSLAVSDLPGAARESRLAESFFPAAILARAVALAATDELGLDLYLRANDGALLVYHCTGSAAQIQLLGNRGTDIDSRLKAGTLRPAQFIRQLAAVGTLTVIDSGQVWDKVGVVGPDWRAFERLQQGLGPTFVSADDAARYRYDGLDPNAEVDARGFILRRTDGTFVGTRPVTAQAWRRAWGLPSADGTLMTRVELEGFEFVGLYHYARSAVPPIPDGSVEQGAFAHSVPDIVVLAATLTAANQARALYTARQGGALLKYRCSGSREERTFAATLMRFLANGTVDDHSTGYDGTPQALVKALLNLGELSVLTADAAWYNVRGTLPRTWRPNTPFSAAIVADAPLSWVFADLATAVRYAHDRLQATSGGRRVGFILKHEGSAQFVVSEPSEPVPAYDSQALFALSRVFPAGADGQPRLPAGYGLRGLYLRGEVDSRGIGNEPWMYEGFIATRDLAHAIARARAEPDRSLALYLTTRDGAQLGYEVSGSAEESQLYHVLPDGSITDNGLGDELRAGTLTPQALVLKVAAAGALSVLQVGTLWDVPGLVGDTWRPFTRAPQPRLSAGFLQVEDAARHAHGQIAGQREREYCGYILQRPDGLYVATEPLYAGDAGCFVLGVVYPLDGRGRSLLPTGHRLAALYGSCRAVSMLDSTRVQRPGWTRDEVYLEAQMFTAADLHTLLQNRQQVAVAYLSNAEDSLLALDVSTSSGLAVPGAKRLPRPESWIRQVAAAASLRVVLGGRLWGAPGLISEHWRPSQAVVRRQAPEQVAYGPVCASAQEAAQLMHRQTSTTQVPTQTGYAFILKHRDKDAFVCSEPVPAWSQAELFAQGGVFQVDAEGRFIYPAGYQLHALFYARHWMPPTLASHEHWLARHFISVEDLASATVEARRLRDPGASSGLAVFISTLDRALLRSQVPVASSLFEPIRQASGMFEDVQTLVAAGQLSSVAFINQVAQLSELTVLVPSECWGVPGKLQVSQQRWRAFGNFLRRPLSPLFSCAADAVRYACQQLGNRREQSYGGLVLERRGKFVATLAVPVLSEDFSPGTILPDEEVSPPLLAPGWRTVARYRSRAATVLPFWLPEGEHAVYQQLFSTAVLETALKSAHLWTHEYLLGPEGSLLGFTTQDTDRDLMNKTQRDEAARLLAELEQALAPNHLAPHDPYGNAMEQQMRSGHKRPSELVNLLARIGTLQVLEGSALWGTARRVTSGWQPSQDYQRPESLAHAVADRALSPVFKHADDAAGYGHEVPLARGELTFGVILKSSDNGHFVASAPAKGDDLGFSLDRVFPRGHLPTGYSLQGLYLRLPNAADSQFLPEPDYAQVAAPNVVLAALSFLRLLTSASERFLPLYVSCPDGGLVRYQALQLDRDWATAERQAAYLQRLGSNSIQAYVRKLARSGELRLLAGSPLWNNLAHLMPRTVAADPRLGLGPLCAHPDDAARLVWQRFAALPPQARLGAILGNGDSDTFIAVHPTDDPGPSVAVGLRRDTAAWKVLFEGVMNLAYTSTSTRYPAGYQVLGVQQLYKLDSQRERLTDRYEEALAHNFIHQSEIRGFIEMLRQDKVAGARYYFTPAQGALIVYEPGYHQDESRLLRDDWVDPATGAVNVKPSEVIRGLATFGKLTILEVDRFWQPRSQVGRHLVHTLREVDQAD